MSREDLAVPLALVALATSIGLAAMKQADWKHKALIWALLAVATALFALGVAWHWIKDDLPQIGAVLNDFAASRIVWFVTGMFCLAALLFRMPKPATPAPNQSFDTSRDGSAQPEAALGARIAALDARIGQVDEKLRAAIHSNAEAARKEAAALSAGVKERIEALRAAAETRAADLDRALADTKQATQDYTKGATDGLIHALEQVRRRQDTLECALEARDAKQKLSSWDVEARRLFARLLQADADDYAGDGTPRDFELAWAGEYAVWKSRLEDFWAVAAEWGSPFPDLFNPPASDYERIEQFPPATVRGKLEHRWRTAVLVGFRHRAAAAEVLDHVRSVASVRRPNPA